MSIDEAMTFDDAKKCIEKVYEALHGNTNWKESLTEIARLCYTVLWILFIMARHVHPNFPMMADWAILSRFKGQSLTQKCVFENSNRQPGEPRWHPSCFADGELVLGTDMDSRNLYLKAPNQSWVRLDLQPSQEFQKILIQKRQQQTENVNSVDQTIWSYKDFIQFATL